jgi:hypothetical protein
MYRLPEGDAPAAKPSRAQAFGRALMAIRRAEVGRPINLVVEVEEIGSS